MTLDPRYIRIITEVMLDNLNSRLSRALIRGMAGEIGDVIDRLPPVAPPENVAIPPGSTGATLSEIVEKVAAETADQ